MKTSLVPIGNSKGIRIPKLLLEESGISKDVEIKASKGMLKIIPIKTPVPKHADETALLSEKTLRKDWDRLEEDKAWVNL